MAQLTPTLVTVKTGSGASGSLSTDSVTATKNRLYTVFVRGRDNGGNPNTPTLSGWGLVWTLEEAQESSGNGCWCFRASGNPSTGALTADFAGQGISTIAIIAVEWQYSAKGGTSGADGIRQSVPGTGGASSSFSISTAALLNSNSVSVGFLIQKNKIATITPGSGQTAIQNQGFDGDDSWIVQYKRNSTTQDCTSSDGTGDWLGIALEIKFQPGGVAQII